MSLGRVILGSFGLALFLGTAATGCSEEGTSEEQNITPDGAESPYALAGMCDQNIQRHSAVRPQELADGVVRWQCGDRPGVDGADDRGQEYCEYHAVSNGKFVDTFADVDAQKPLYCVFTSVYTDVADGTSRDQHLAAELAKPENLNAPVDYDTVRMKGRFNSRGAATTLVKDAMAVAKSTNDDRQAACYLAGVKDPSKAEQLKKLCDGVNLASKTAWSKVTKLGVSVPKAGTADYEHFRDVVACMSVGRLQNGGVDWRMSDPHITQVTVRANDECGCTYGALPDALEGFLQGTWSSKDALPPGCRRAKVDGADYPQLTICEVPESERGDLETDLDYNENLQAFCNDRFGTDIVLTAPLRAVEKKGSCSKKTSEFCSQFTKTANY